MYFVPAMYNYLLHSNMAFCPGLAYFINKTYTIKYQQPSKSTKISIKILEMSKL